MALKPTSPARFGRWMPSWPPRVLLLLSVAAAACPALAAKGPRELAAPVRIALMPGERLLVSDYDAEAIHIVDRRDLSVLRSFAVGGKPVAVAWGFNRIFVGNETLGRVEVYSLRGKLVATLGEPGSIGLPNAVAVDAEVSQVLVLDAFEKVVKVFSPDGIFLYSLTQPGALQNPSAMTFDPLRRWVLVSDFGGFSDNIFSEPQTLVRHFDLSGNEIFSFTGTFARPQGLTVDGLGRLYLVDSFKAEVQVLDAANGALLGVLGGFGSSPGQLSLPLDVVCSPGEGNLYVTDNRNGRIAAFAQWATP